MNDGDNDDDDSWLVVAIPVRDSGRHSTHDNDVAVIQVVWRRCND
jgi:hypothetical protein